MNTKLALQAIKMLENEKRIVENRLDEIHLIKIGLEYNANENIEKRKSSINLHLNMERKFLKTRLELIPEKIEKYRNLKIVGLNGEIE